MAIDSGGRRGGACERRRPGDPGRNAVVLPDAVASVTIEDRPAIALPGRDQVSRELPVRVHVHLIREFAESSFGVRTGRRRSVHIDRTRFNTHRSAMADQSGH